jgi:folylpolyglutamate synthase/dihydropteroate synthase
LFALTALVTLACAAPPSTAAPLARPDDDLVALYESGLSLRAFVDIAEQRKELWEQNIERAVIPDDIASRAEALTGTWRLLVVAADWCLDSAHNIPALALLAETTGSLELRVVNAEAGAEVMEARKTVDGRPATPTIVILDDHGAEVGCWVERPARQREHYFANMKNAEEGSEERNAAVADFLGWYRENNGAAALGEVMTLLEAAMSGAHGCTVAGG